MNVTVILTVDTKNSFKTGKSCKDNHSQIPKITKLQFN